MKVDSKILSIPPYISADWSQIRAIYMKDDMLHVALVEGDTVEVPGLSQEQIGHIFTAHAEFVEELYKHSAEIDIESPQLPTSFSSLTSLANQAGNPAIQMSFGGSGETWANAMQHNPNQANLQDLPKEILDKITSISKVIIPEEIMNLTKPEPHCNCVHCQIVKAMNPNSALEELEQVEIDEEVSDEDLRFSQWEATETGNKVYIVTNKLDNREEYHVCLDPVRCTCGQKGCEHIIAVLES